MKRLLCLFVLAILTFALFACENEGSHAVATGPAESFSGEAETDAVPEKVAVRELTCVKGEARTGLFAAFSADNGIFAFQDGWVDCRFIVVDSVKDELKAVYESASSDDVLAGVCKNGDAVALNYVENVIRVYSPEGTKELKSDLRIEDYQPMFDPKSERLFGYGKKGVVTFGLDGSARVELELPRDANILGLSHFGESVIVSFSGEKAGLHNEIVRLDLAGKEICSFDTSSLTAEFCYNNIATSDTLFIGENEEKTVVRIYSGSDGSYVGGCSVEGDHIFYFNPFSRYTYSVSFNGYMNSDLSFLDLGNGMLADLSAFTELDGSFMNISGAYGEFGESIALATTDQDGNVAAYIVDPSLLSYTEPVEPIPAPEESGSASSAPYLSDARTWADKIEEKYGVEILIGDEILSAEEQGEYVFTSTTSGEDGYSDEEEISDVVNMLNIIDTSLSRYPDGFTRSFINSRGKGGLRFLLVRDMASDQNESFTAAGLQYNTGAWYNVALDVDSVYENSVHHEIWHAAELLIDLLTSGIDENEWSELNPDGFAYQYDFDTYTDNEEIMNYVLYSSDDPYFTRIYSTVTPQEDRATLIEETLAMVGDYQKRNNFIYSYPRLVAKLDYLARLSEECFGYVYWEKMTEN